MWRSDFSLVAAGVENHPGSSRYHGSYAHLAERYDRLVSVEPVVAGYGQSEDPSSGQ